ncbi:MAG: glycosyltransferase [Gammaproteobacteria bacterium]
MTEQSSLQESNEPLAAEKVRRVPQKELRIAVLSDSLKDRNGVDAYYRDLVSHLQRHVAQVEYLTPNPEDGELYTRFRFPMPGDSTQQVIFPHAPGLNARLKALQPHVIVAATNGPFGLFAVYAARRLNAQLVAGFHTLIEDLCGMYWGRVLGGVTRSYMELQNRIIFRNSERVVVNSNSMIDSAANLSATPVTLMGTPLDKLFVDTPICLPRQELKKVLYAGRLAPEKNIEGFIDCATQLPDLEFTIAGDGPLRADIEQHAATLPNLQFLGHLPRNEIVNSIDSHDLLVLPSHLEAFGTIALEAMVRQRLVLVSSHCGILSWQSLNEGLYQFSDEESVAEAIQRIAGLDTRQRDKKMRHARETALQVHEQAITGWLELFTELSRAH